MTRLTLVGMAIGVALGALFALSAAPAVTEAGHSYRSIWWGPPVGPDNANVWLTRGWGDDLPPSNPHPPDTISLDWDYAPSDERVWARSAGFSMDPWNYPGPRFWAVVTQSAYWNCSNVNWVDIYDLDAWFYLGEERWISSLGLVHTIEPQQPLGWILWASEEFELNPGVHVANMAHGDSCGWAGEHVHEAHVISDQGWHEATWLNTQIPTLRNQSGILTYNNLGVWTRIFWYGFLHDP